MHQLEGRWETNNHKATMRHDSVIYCATPARGMGTNGPYISHLIQIGPTLSQHVQLSSKTADMFSVRKLSICELQCSCVFLQAPRAQSRERGRDKDREKMHMQLVQILAAAVGYTEGHSSVGKQGGI